MRLVDRLRVLLAAVAIVALVPIAAGPEQTEAAWTDSEYATTAVSSGFVARPNPGQACTTALASATFFWTAGAGGVPRGGYVVSAFLDGAPVGTPQTYPANATQASTATLLSSLLGGRTYEIRVQAFVGSQPTSWTSPRLVGTLRTTLAGLVTGCTGLAVP